MEDSFPAELWQASKVWHRRLETDIDLEQQVNAGEIFWIPADKTWITVYVLGLSCFSILSVLVFGLTIYVQTYGGGYPWLPPEWAWSYWIVFGLLILGIGVGFPLFQRRYRNPFLAIGPNGVLYREQRTASWFRWSDLERVEHLATRLPEGSPVVFIEKIKCTFISGEIKLLSNDHLSNAVVPSFDMFKRLFLAYWNKYQESRSR